MAAVVLIKKLAFTTPALSIAGKPLRPGAAAGDVDGDGGVAPADSERGQAPVVTAWSVVVLDHPGRTIIVGRTVELTASHLLRGQMGVTLRVRV